MNWPTNLSRHLNCLLEIASQMHGRGIVSNDTPVMAAGRQE